MAKMPTEFRKSAESTTSYSFTDTLNGVGYVLFYGSVTQDGYVLTQQQVYSDVAYTATGTTLSSSYSTIFEQTFSMTFNRPQYIKGKLIANIPIFQSGSGNAGATTNNKATVTVYHSDGVTDTSLGSEVSSETPNIVTGTNATPIRYQYKLVEVEIAGQQFRQGDILKITVKAEGKVSASNTAGYMGHDPAGRTDGIGFTVTSTSLRFLVPFRLDI